jgi:hypothetical protein
MNVRWEVTMDEKLARPPYWLVIGLEWPDSAEGLAEAAYAVAPGVVRDVRPLRDGAAVPLSKQADGVLYMADCYVERHPLTYVVSLAELTVWLSDLGTTWEQVGVNFWDVYAELTEYPIGLFVTVTEEAHAMLCNTARVQRFSYSDGPTRTVTAEMRAEMKAQLGLRLEADWPPYINERIAAAA